MKNRTLLTAIAALLILSLLGACSSRQYETLHSYQLRNLTYSTDNKEMLDSHGKPELREGVSQAQMRGWFGEPAMEENDPKTGLVTWHYFMHESEFRTKVEGDFRLLTPYIHLEINFDGGVVSHYQLNELNRVR